MSGNRRKHLNVVCLPKLGTGGSCHVLLCVCVCVCVGGGRGASCAEELGDKGSHLSAGVKVTHQGIMDAFCCSCKLAS